MQQKLQNKKIKKLQSCLQIGDNDLIGNKFNGHDLHLYLQESGVDAKHFVTNKDSNDNHTYVYPKAASCDEFMTNLIYSSLFVEADIVHLHLIHNTAFDMNYIPIISNLKPLVWTIHDPWAFSGHCIHPFNCTQWLSGCHCCNNLMSPFAVPRDICALNFQVKKNAIQNSQISAIVASKWMKDKFEQSPIWNGKKVYHVPFGVNQELFKPKNLVDAKRELNIPEKNFVIFFRADLNPFKGFDIVKNLLENLKSVKDITLITVGRTGMLNEYKKYFDIKEFGWLKDDKKLVKLYQACDLFLMPSKQEAFGMMAIEAMSCGKTVLALNGTALPDVINSPECGVAVDEIEYNSAFFKLYNNRDLLEEHNQKSLKYAQENYNKDVYIEKMIEVYKEIISNHNLSEEYSKLLETIKKNTCFYEPLTTTCVNSDYKKYKRKYWKYKILRLITTGKLKEKYKMRYQGLKSLVKQYKKFSK